MRRFLLSAVALCALSALVADEARAGDWSLSDGGSIAKFVGRCSEGDRIVLGTGTYAVQELTVSKGVAIVAKEGCVATIDVQSLPYGIVLDHAGASLEGCRIVNCGESAVTVKSGARVTGCEFVGPDGAVGSSSASFLLQDGTVSGCVFRNFAGALMSVSGGVCAGLVVSNCANTAWTFRNALSVSGGRLTDFLIDNVGGYERCLDVSGTAVVSNGVLNGVGRVQFNHSQQDTIRQRALCQGGGLVSHVVVTNCGAWHSSSEGLVRLSGGTMRNCLIAGNRSTDCAGLYLCGGHAESCTVAVDEGASLHLTEHLMDGSTLVMTGGSATNCVFLSTETASDDRHACRVTGGAIGFCWLGLKGADVLPAGEGVRTGDDPRLMSVGGWSWVPASGSPLIGAGINQPWMTGATDLSGRRRVRGRRTDIGAFEGAAAGALLSFR